MAESSRASRQAGPSLRVLASIFFAWGFATSLIDTLIPQLKGAFGLSYAEAMLTQSAFFIAYLAVSRPAAHVASRFGDIPAATAALLIMAVGAGLFAIAAAADAYWPFLLAFFGLATGVTLLQVSANTLAFQAAAPAAAHSRLTFAQAFNALGTFAAPFVGAAIVLRGGVETITPADIQAPFLVLAAGLALLAGVLWRKRFSTGGGERGRAPASVRTLVAQSPRVAGGAAAIFLYVGAEVALGSFMISYLGEARTLDASPRYAANLLAAYWGGALIGRLAGAAILLRVRAPLALATAASAALVLLLVSALSSGWLAAGSVLLVGLCNAIMFPTIFGLSIEGLGKDAPAASGLLCTAIVGGAVIPLAMGLVADRAGLAAALSIPAACYVGIAVFAVAVRRGAVSLPPES